MEFKIKGFMVLYLNFWTEEYEPMSKVFKTYKEAKEYKDKLNDNSLVIHVLTAEEDVKWVT